MEHSRSLPQKPGSSLMFACPLWQTLWFLGDSNSDITFGGRSEMGVRSLQGQAFLGYAVNPRLSNDIFAMREHLFLQ